MRQLVAALEKVALECAGRTALIGPTDRGHLGHPVTPRLFVDVMVAALPGRRARQDYPRRARGDVGERRIGAVLLDVFEHVDRERQVAALGNLFAARDRRAQVGANDDGVGIAQVRVCQDAVDADRVDPSADQGADVEAGAAAPIDRRSGGEPARDLFADQLTRRRVGRVAAPITGEELAVVYGVELHGNEYTRAMPLSRETAWAKLREWTASESLRNHARAVELVMRAAAGIYGHGDADVERWGIAGMLHDADYDRWPSEHPNRIVAWVRESGEPEIAYAISAHYTKWGVPHESALDKALLACDELTGFIVACCLVRPEGVATLKRKSVQKKLKDKRFAASVERAEVHAGAELLGIELGDHIDFVIEALRPHADELGIGPKTE